VRDVCPRQRKEAREETTMAELLIMGPGFNAAQISLVIGLARPVNSSWTCVKQLQHIGLVCCMLTNAALLLKVPQLHAGSGSRHNRANPETRTLNPKQAVRRAGKEPGERGALAHAQAGLHRGARDSGALQKPYSPWLSPVKPGRRACASRPTPRSSRPRFKETRLLSQPHFGPPI